MPYDAAIVLGGGRDSDKCLNSRTFARLSKALKLFQSGQFDKLILSGGISFSAPAGFTCTEAGLMREYLLAQGIAERHLHLEETSTDTLGNAYFSKVQILEANNWRSLLVITSAFHIARCRYLFQKVLGNGYVCSFAACGDNITPEESEQLEKLESHIRQIYGRWLDGIADGDSSAIEKVLFERHPGHAPNPDYTKDQFIKLLYGDRST